MNQTLQRAKSCGWPQVQQGKHHYLSPGQHQLPSIQRGAGNVELHRMPALFVCLWPALWAGSRAQTGFGSSITSSQEQAMFRPGWRQEKCWELGLSQHWPELSTAHPAQTGLQAEGFGGPVTLQWQSVLSAARWVKMPLKVSIWAVPGPQGNAEAKGEARGRQWGLLRAPKAQHGVRAVQVQHLPQELCPAKHSFWKAQELQSRWSERDSSKESWQGWFVLPQEQRGTPHSVHPWGCCTRSSQGTAQFWQCCQEILPLLLLWECPGEQSPAWPETFCLLAPDLQQDPDPWLPPPARPPCLIYGLSGGEVLVTGITHFAHLPPADPTHSWPSFDPGKPLGVPLM